MKKNCFGILFGILGLLSSQAIFALGLGDITTQSALNQPLVAEIELINVGSLENSQILVGIGTESDYALAGVTKEFFHSDLEFEVFAEGNNPRIAITSNRPLQDPYLNIMVQARWPQGKILREYTLLLDMPVFSQQETQSNRSSASNAATPSTARQASQAQAAAQSTQTAQTTQTTQARTQPVRSSSTASIGSNSSYQVSEGETLWSISGRVAQSAGMGRHQAMIAIHEQNPNAFVNGNIHALKAGSSLSVPSSSQIGTRSEREAVSDFRTIGGELGATPLSSVTNTIGSGNNATDSSESGRLALSSSADSSVGGLLDTQSDLAIEEAQETVAATLSENLALKEELDAAEIANRDLQERIANLEEQIELAGELVQEDSAVSDIALEINDDSLDLVEEAQDLLEIEEPVEEVTPAPVAVPEPPKSFLEKYLIPILAAVGSLIVLCLIAAFMLFKRKSNSDHDDLLMGDDYADNYDEPAPSAGVSDDDYDDEDDYDDDEDSDSYSEEHEEAIDELLSGDEDEPEDDGDAVDQLEEELAEETEDTLASSSFDDADEGSDDEFGDLDEFFSDEDSDATNVIFGEEGDEQIEGADAKEEISVSDEAAAPEASIEEAEEAGLEHAEGNELEFDLGDLDLGEETSDVLVEADDELDLENSFEFTESDISEDLGDKAESDFSESLEVHAPELSSLLVPSDDEENSESEIDLGSDELADLDEADLDADPEPEADSIEEIEEELDSGSEEALEDLGDDLDLDDDMDTDLGDLDFDDAELDDLDGDEEFITKLELAEAYIEMGDVQGAKELLAEVEKDGTDEQKTAAKDLLERASK